LAFQSLDSKLSDKGFQSLDSKLSDKGYSRKVSYALNEKSTFLLGSGNSYLFTIYLLILYVIAERYIDADMW
jgi:hypothetical protein